MTMTMTAPGLLDTGRDENNLISNNSRADPLTDPLADGGDAVQLAGSAMDAKAFTVGSDIPVGSAGASTAAHESAHVIQQH